MPEHPPTGMLARRTRLATCTCVATLLLAGLQATSLGQSVIIDNDNANNTAGTFTVLSGTWTLTSAGTAGEKWLADYRYTNSGGTLSEVEWRSNLSVAGDYAVSTYYRQGTNRAPDAPFTVHHAGGSTTIDVDQRINGGTWFSLGTYTFNAGTAGSVTLSDAAASGVVIADAVRFEPTGPPPPAPPAFRGFWIDAFGEGFKSAAQIDTMISRAVTGRYNAVVAEVLAYQDTSTTDNGHGAYWKSNIVPWAPVVTTSFDPLAYLCQTAHENNIEVHAWLVAFRVSTAWPPNGNITLSAHPEWTMVPQASMGLGPATVDGKYVMDPGSPDVQEYIVSIVRELVGNYEIDGINFDYIRYTVTNAGYPADNTYDGSSLARFRRITGYVGTPPPTDTAWSDFRRRTVNELIRRCRAEIPSIRTNPRQPLRLTADLYGSGGAPADFTDSEAYTLHQNWKLWLEMGWLDAGMPMNYKDDRNSTHAAWYRSWIDAAVSYRDQRHVFCGQGNYLNSKANSVVQLQYVYSAGANGSVNYAYRSTADENDDGVEEADWSWYPYVAANLFTAPAPVPTMPWRDPALATEGTLWGRVTDHATGEPLDDVTVTVGALPPVRTDGNGYYVVTLVPATGAGTSYTVTAAHADYTDPASGQAVVPPGDIASLDLALGVPPVPFDFDGDQDVDLADYRLLAICLGISGPATPLSPGHTCLADSHTDVDGDSDIDLADFAAFQAGFAQ